VSSDNPRQQARKLQVQMRQMCAMLSGMLVAMDYEKGQRLLANRNFREYADFFQMVHCFFLRRRSCPLVFFSDSGAASSQSPNVLFFAVSNGSEEEDRV